MRGVRLRVIITRLPIRNDLGSTSVARSSSSEEEAAAAAPKGFAPLRSSTVLGSPWSARYADTLRTRAFAAECPWKGSHASTNGNFSISLQRPTTTEDRAGGWTPALSAPCAAVGCDLSQRSRNSTLKTVARWRIRPPPTTIGATTMSEAATAARHRRCRW